MLANPTVLEQTLPRTSQTDRQALLLAAMRNVVPAPAKKEEAARLSLLEYAAFVLDQEARYCQQ